MANPTRSLRELPGVQERCERPRESGTADWCEPVLPITEVPVSPFRMRHPFTGPRRDGCECPYCFAIPEGHEQTPEELEDRQRKERLHALWDRMEALAEQGKHLKEREADRLDEMLVGSAIDEVLRRILAREE